MQPRATPAPVARLAAMVVPMLSLSVLATPPDLAAGEAAYAKCVACHSPELNRTGPRHCGLIGRVAGTVAGYDYSEAMRDSGITWTATALDRFLAAPLTFLPGTTMGFAGIRDTDERRNLIAWLATLDAHSKDCANQ